MYNGEVLQVVDNIKYLGIIFKFNNNFDVCQKSLHDQRQKAMYALLGKASNLALDVEIQI